MLINIFNSSHYPYSLGFSLNTTLNTVLIGTPSIKSILGNNSESFILYPGILATSLFPKLI